jgi:membrane protein implicated in regulation of membrane protease activity
MSNLLVFVADSLKGLNWVAAVLFHSRVCVCVFVCLCVCLHISLAATNAIKHTSRVGMLCQGLQLLIFSVICSIVHRKYQSSVPDDDLDEQKTPDETSGNEGMLCNAQLPTQA